MSGIDWLTRRQRDGGIDELPLPPGVPGAIWMCGKLAIGGDHGRALAEVGGWATVVCLTEAHELQQRFPAYVEWLRDESNGAVWWPIPDLHAPALSDIRVLIDDLVTRVRRGETLLVHCAAGMGRTGTVAICVLLGLGIGLDEARSTVATARPGAGPEVGAQEQLVRLLAAEHGSSDDGSGGPASAAGDGSG